MSNSVLNSQTNLGWDILLNLDTTGRGPLYVRLTAALRNAIRDGRLPPGSALPPSRLMASDLGTSRWVVTEAYEQLAAEGYLEARVGSGTRVRSLHQDVVKTPAGRTHMPPRARIDFGPGLPDLKAFPRRSWLKALRTVIVSAPNEMLAYPPLGGHPRLRQVLADYLRRVRGTVTSVDNITITSGIVDGISQLARRLAKEGVQGIAVENPGWETIRWAVQSSGLKVGSVPVDADGMRTDLLSTAEVGAAIVTPAHQFPTGSVLTPERRLALLSWAHSVGGLVLEDDYDAEFRYDRRPVGTLQGIDSTCVALFGSMSKTLSPALSLGWMVTPPQWTELLHEKEARIAGPPVIDQLALAEFIESGAYDRHLRELRRRYRSRRDRVVAGLAAQLPDCCVSGVAAGLHILLTLPGGVTGAAVRAATAERMRVMDLQVCRSEVIGHQTHTAGRFDHEGVVLGYGNLADDEVDEAVDLLAKVVRQLGMAWK